MKIISVIQENKLKESYARLIDFHNTLGSKLKYATDPKFGFLVSSPSEIGTGGFFLEAEIKATNKIVNGHAIFGMDVPSTVTTLLNEIAKK